MPALHEIIVRPVVTEKSSAAYQTRKEYTFEVHPEANKHADPRRAREAVRREGDGRLHHADARGKRSPAAGTRGHDAALEEGDRDAQGGRHDRRLRGLR